MQLYVRITDDGDTGEIEISLDENYPPMVYKIRLLQALLEQATGAAVSLVHLYLSTAQLGLDVYLEEYFTSRNEATRKKIVDTLLKADI